MTNVPHIVVKPQEIIESGIEALTDKLQVSNTVTRMSDIEPYNRAQGDAVTLRVPAPLPVRTYAPRNDRSMPIITDVAEETTVTATITRDHPYNAVRVTDEQLEWDLGSWQPLIDRQTSALAENLENRILTQIVNAKYEVIVGVDASPAAVAAAIARNEDLWFNTFVDVSRYLDLLRNPDMNITAVVGINIGAAIRKSNKLALHQGGGDNALSRNVIGTLAGITVVESKKIDPNEGYVYSKSAFVNYNAAPRIPQSVPFGATASVDGFALRWLMDYDTSYLSDRSVFDAWVAYGVTEDIIAVEDQQGILHNSTDQYFVRGVKLVMVNGSDAVGMVTKMPGDGKTGNDETPGSDADSFLAKAFHLGQVTSATPEGKPFPLGGNFPITEEDAAKAPLGDGKGN